MGRLALPRALLAALAVAFVIVPAGALAASPEIFHVNFMDTEEDVDVCGITVDIVSEGVFTDKAFFDKEGNLVSFMSTASARSTLTAENGKSVIISNAGSFTEGEASRGRGGGHNYLRLYF
ncbi:MAG TPA: hypothetical protein VGJ34_12365 [Gaiellaceae bacterium]|jgi:hypothetical protein